MPINIDGFPVTPYGHPDDITVYVNEQEYFGVTYVRVVKRINQLDSFEMKISDVIYSDANVLYNKIVKIFAESKLLLKGIITEVKYQTDGNCNVKGYGMGWLLANKQYVTRTTFSDFTNNLVNKFLSLNNDSISPYIINPNIVENFGDAIDFRAEFDNKLQIVDALARQIEWDWYVDNGDIPYNSDTFNFMAWRGSLAPVYTVELSGDSQNGMISERNDNFHNLINSIAYLGKGEGTSQIQTKFSFASTIYDRLTDTVTSGNIALSLIKGTNFPTAGGVVVIGRNAIDFDGKAGPLLVGITFDTENGSVNTTHYRGVLCFLLFDSTGATFDILSVAVTPTDTTISVVNNTDFTASGSLVIGREVIDYTTKGTNTFTGLTRGAKGTLALAHDDVMQVYQYDSTKYYSDTTPQAGSSIQINELKQMVLTDPSKESERQMELEGANWLLRNSNITYNITFEMMDYFDFLNNVNLGDRIQIIDDDTGLNDNFRTLGIDLTWDMGSVKLLIISSNKKITESSFADSIADISKTLSSRLTYAQT